MPNNDNFKTKRTAFVGVNPAILQPLAFTVVANKAAAAPAAAAVINASAGRDFAASAVRNNPKAVPMREEVVFSTLAETKFFNPVLGVHIAAVANAAAATGNNGVPRTQVTVPISPTADISDERLFESPNEPGKNFYLPRYRIQQETVAEQQRIRAGLRQEGNGGSLTIALEPYAPEPLAEASRTAQVLPHAVSVLLRYSVGGTQQELEFQEKSASLDEVVLRLNGLELYGRVFRALSDGQASGTQLIIRRLIQVAVPVPPRPARPVKRPPNVPPEEIDPDLPPALKKKLLDKNRFGRPIFMPFVHLAAAGDEPPQVPLFRITDRALDVAPVRIDWPELLFGYVYKSPAPPVPPESDNELIVRSVDFEGRTYRYFQDAARREVFFCLPDSFKLARQPNSPYYPFMSVRFMSTDGALNSTQVQLAYVAVPYAKAARLKAAAARLVEFVPDGRKSEITLQPLSTTNLTFRLAVPGSGSTAGPFQERTGVSIDLRSALRDQLTLSLNDFQLIFNALATPSSLLFQGEILVKVQEGVEEAIPFTARLADLAGNLFDYESVPNAATGSVAVTLRNAIESPATISRLSASLFYDDTEIPAVLNQFTAPVEVKPEEAIAFEVAPASAADVRPGITPRVVFSMDTEVHPNQTAVWEAIVDPFTPSDYRKTVTVKTFKELFADPDKPDIAAILVDVEGGNTVELSGDMLTGTTEAQLPLRDVVLNAPGSGQFRFRVSVVQPTGTKEGEWRTAGGSTTLFITKNLLP